MNGEAGRRHSKTLTDVSKRMMIEHGANTEAGLDIGDKYSQICWLDLNIQIVISRKIRTSTPALE